MMLNDANECRITMGTTPVGPSPDLFIPPKKLESNNPEKKKSGKALSLDKNCPGCGAVRTQIERCPYCGHPLPGVTK